MAGRIVSFVPDILVEMRIDSAARALDADLDSVSAAEYLEAALNKGADVLVVDLGMDGIDLNWIVSVARGRKVPIVAFGPHVEIELLRAAEDAGMDAVYPRSAFMKEMGKILGEHVSGGKQGPA